MKTNYFKQFCQNIFGIGYEDQVHSDEITLWFREGKRTRNITDHDIADAINLNTKINVSLTAESKGTDAIMCKDGFLYKITFSNGILYEKTIKEVINKCALITIAK